MGELLLAAVREEEEKNGPAPPLFLLLFPVRSLSLVPEAAEREIGITSENLDEQTRNCFICSAK